MKENYFKNSIAEMWIEDDILYVRHNQNVVITKEVAIDMVKERLLICENTTYPMFFDTRGIKYATKEAREYTKGGEGMRCINAGGFLVNNAVLEILVNYYLKFNRPKVPVKLFTDETKALKWLRQFKSSVSINQLR